VRISEQAANIPVHNNKRLVFMTKTANGAVRTSINIIPILSPTSHCGGPGSNPGQTT